MKGDFGSFDLDEIIFSMGGKCGGWVGIVGLGNIFLKLVDMGNGEELNWDGKFGNVFWFLIVVSFEG